eukprot:PhM_4_TR6535/c0_g1_i1/m.69953
MKFVARAVEELPFDTDRGSHTREVPNACYTHTNPSPVQNPQIVSVSSMALSLIGRDGTEHDTADIFSGNVLPEGATPFAHCYCGHQFGYFSGQLGDGAAISLGEVEGPSGDIWEVQLKGAGGTPFSRAGDGRKVLRSSIREYLCSELMHYLGIPTTRAGACLTSDTMVERDAFYNGNPKNERCTIVTRLAPTFLRFGSYQIVNGTDPVTGRSGPSPNNTQLLWRMLEYTAKHFFPHIYKNEKNWMADRPNHTAAMFHEVALRTAKLVAQWQAVGFCHGVLNTDNMSVIGLTIDYGPFGFLETYDPGHVCNTSDTGARYTYAEQPSVCRWNLDRLLDTWAMVCPAELMKPALEAYDSAYEKHYYELMFQKLGLPPSPSGLLADKKLVDNLLTVMQTAAADYTDTFRLLSQYDDSSDPAAAAASLHAAVGAPKSSVECQLRRRLQQCRLDLPEAQLRQLLQLHDKDPEALFMMFPDAPREHILSELREEEATLLKREDIEMQLKRLLSGNMRTAAIEGWERWLATYFQRIRPPPTQPLGEARASRLRQMMSVNPQIVLRSWIAQDVIESAEKLHFSAVTDLLHLVTRPYETLTEQQRARWGQRPDWADGVCVSCSS